MRRVTALAAAFLVVACDRHPTEPQRDAPIAAIAANFAVSAAAVWEEMAPAPSPFYYAPMTAHAGAVYALRGSDFFTQTSTFWRYDPALNAWTVLAPIPATVNYTGGASLTATPDHVYGIAGSSYGGARWLFRYDPDNNT